MITIAFFTITPLLLYIVLICRYTFHWKRIPEYLPHDHSGISGISVIIPFRNEEKALPNILDDMSKQDFPVAQTEIILVDDHSYDNSVAIVREYCNLYSHFRLIQMLEDKKGKKEAIDAGNHAANHELIVTTDADCRAGKQWLSTIASFYRDFAPVMIIGLVIPETSGLRFFDYFQLIESISLTGAGASSAIIGNPIFCSGANLCYRKDIYFRYKDPMVKAVASGDDTFLLLQLKKHYRAHIKVLKSKQALISTKTKSNLHDFLRQRSRWISKSLYYRDWEILRTALVVLLANLSVLTAGLYWLLADHPWLFMILFIMKLLADGFFMSALLAFLHIKFRPGAYLVSGIVYPFYLSLSIAWAFLVPVQWKGRIQ